MNAMWILLNVYLSIIGVHGMAIFNGMASAAKGSSLINEIEMYK